jgi:transcriptional regulator with PAS, ATPase and Fis domain
MSDKDSELNEIIQQRAREMGASEARFHNIVTISTDGIVIVDSFGTILFVNPAAKLLFGRTEEELLGEPFGFPIVAGEATELEIVNRVRKRTIAEMRVVSAEWERQPAFLATLHDITAQKLAEGKAELYLAELEKKNTELQEALANIKTLSDMLPICAYCKKIRDDKGYWSQVEEYICKHTDTVFSHGICPECAKKVYEEMGIPPPPGLDLK